MRLAGFVFVFSLAAWAQTPDVRATLRGPAIGDEQLEPYFTSAQSKAALADYQAGRAAEALRKLPSKAKDWPTRWLRAVSLRAAGQPHLARALFEQLASGPLADRAMHLAGLCAVDEGDPQSAEKLLGQVSLRYVDADQALLERARQTIKAHVPGPATAAQVEAILEPIFDGTVRADVASAHLLAGDAQLAAGAKEWARTHYRKAWVDHPLSPAADSARDRERQLPRGTAVAALQLLRRAETLLEAHRNRDALDQLSQIEVPPLCSGLGCPGDHTPGGMLAAAITALAPQALPEQHQPTPEDVARSPTEPADPLACRVKLDQGRAWRKEHDYLKARNALAPVVLRCADPDVRTRALYLLAQLESMSGKPDAGPLWEALARKYPQSSLADDALFNQALSARRAGDLSKERALLQDLIDHHPDSDLRSETMFRLFFSFYGEGKGRQALKVLDQLAAEPDPDGAEEERARYWRAKVLLDQAPPPAPGQTDAARAAELQLALDDLIWLARDRPLTYHGLLARSLLPPKDLPTGTLAPLPEPLHAGALARDPHLLAAIELIRLGMKPEASRELSAVDRAPARAAGELGMEPLTLIADLYSRAGDFRNAHALVRTELRPLLRKLTTPLALRAASLAYPLAFRDQIAKVAHKSAISPDLLQALMREESALDPKALSSTGALGLTQVMPATARSIAHRLNLRGYQTAQLFDPDTNIRIGGTYLGELLQRFGHPALAFASYNAGPGAVAGWLKLRGSETLDAFVEEIPLDETRGYVKRCLRSFAAYQFLYNNGRIPPLGQRLATR
jgi:soluble lytic murein transglycosylase